MAINNTTLTAAITGYDTKIFVASTTNITAGILSTSSTGRTLLYIDNELMTVNRVPTAGVVYVERGVAGTVAAPHVINSLVLCGGPVDFPQFLPKNLAAVADKFQGVSAAVAAAATIVAPGNVFHVTGTTATNIITPPAGFVEGSITIISDGAWTFTSSAVTNGIAASGAAVTSSIVIFTFDAVTALWYPSGGGGGALAQAVTAPVAAAATLAASGSLFHVTGTTATNIITPPTNFSGQSVTIIADAAWTWTISSAVTNGIAQSGTVTSAGEAVTFFYDPVTALWYPNRRV